MTVNTSLLTRQANKLKSRNTCTCLFVSYVSVPKNLVLLKKSLERRVLHVTTKKNGPVSVDAVQSSITGETYRCVYWYVGVFAD